MQRSHLDSTASPDSYRYNKTPRVRPLYRRVRGQCRALVFLLPGAGRRGGYWVRTDAAATIYLAPPCTFGGDELREEVSNTAHSGIFLPCTVKKTVQETERTTKSLNGDGPGTPLHQPQPATSSSEVSGPLSLGQRHTLLRRAHRHCAQKALPSRRMVRGRGDSQKEGRALLGILPPRPL